MPYPKCNNCDRESCAAVFEDMLYLLQSPHQDVSEDYREAVVEDFWSHTATCKAPDWASRARQAEDRAEVLEDRLVSVEANYFGKKDRLKKIEEEVAHLWKDRIEFTHTETGVTVTLNPQQMDRQPTVEETIQRLRSELDHYRTQYFNLLYQIPGGEE